MVKENADFTRAREQWNSPQGTQGREIAEAVLGQEITIAMPAGFTEKVKPWMELFTAYFETIGPTAFLNGLSGRRMEPDDMKAMFRSAAPKLVPILAKCEALPVVIAIKAGKIRPLVDQGSASLKELVGTAAPNAELGTYSSPRR